MIENISLIAQPLFLWRGIGITNSFLLTIVVLVLLVLFSAWMFFSKRLMPGVVQSGFEMGMEWLLKLMTDVLGSEFAAERYFPLIATIFIFILVSNLLGIFPGIGSLTVTGPAGQVPLFRAPAADLNFTLAFAIVSVVVTNLFGMATVGVFRHLKKFFDFSNPMKFFLGIMELVSELAKIISLSFRLFGNIFAGEVILTVIFYLAPLLIPLPFLIMEVFVGLIQSFLFAILTLVSISLHTMGAENH